MKKAYDSKVSFDLADEKAPYFEGLVSWIDDEWGDATPENREGISKRLLGGIDCPRAVIARIENNAVGVVSFRRSDAPNGDVNALWIDVLYVESEARNIRVGTRLLKEALRLSVELSSSLYVFTGIPEYYEKMGWNIISRDADSGKYILCNKL